MPKTALVLGGGGMFGAYQAGAWQVLASHLQPDMIVGASIGALNSWAIAGGCPPATWVDQWLHMEQAERHRWRFPWPPLSGALDAGPFERFVRELHRCFTPQVPVGLTMTTLPGLRPKLVTTPSITWRHLAASCALFGILPQQKIDGSWFTDGGLLGAVPWWAALEMGAERLVCVNILPKPPRWLTPAQIAMRRIGGHHPRLPASVELVMIEHAQPLGSLGDSLYWTRGKAARWIDAGRSDAEAVVSRTSFLRGRARAWGVRHESGSHAARRPSQ